MITSLGVVGSNEDSGVSSIDVVLSSDVGQTTPTTTAVALVIVQTANDDLSAPGVSSVADNAAVSEPLYDCYGYPVNPVVATGVDQSLADGGEMKSMQVKAYMILALNALLSGDTITVALAGTADYVRVTVLGYTGIWISGDTVVGPPNNIFWGVNNPFFGADGGIRSWVNHRGSDVTNLGGGCWGDDETDISGGTDFIVYIISQGAGTAPSSLTWNDGGVNEAESYYNKGPVPVSTVIGEQAVTTGTDPWDIGGCTDAAPVSDDWIFFQSLFLEDGPGPPYCVVPVVYGVQASVGDYVT